MSQHPAHGVRTLSDYGRLAKRRWVWIAIGVILGLALSALYLYAKAPSYTSTAKVLVRAVGTETTSTGQRGSDPVNLDTEAQLVTSIPVAEIAQRHLDTTLTPVQLVKHVAVTVPPNSTVLAITYTSSTAAKAQQGAQAFADAYLEDRAATANDEQKEEANSLNEQLVRLNKHLDSVNRQLGADPPPSPDLKQTLLADQDSTTADIAAAVSALNQLKTTIIVPGEVIYAAQTPKAATSPDPTLAIPSGLILGLIIGVGLAFLRDRQDRRIHAAADVERLVGIQVLAQIEPSSRDRVDSRSSQHEMRSLYHALIAANAGRRVTVMMVGETPSIADDLCGTLAIVSARAGSTTTLLRKSLTPAPATTGSAAEEENFEMYDYESLGITADGELRSQLAISQIKALNEKRDVVVLGMPTSELVVDVPALGGNVDALVMVVQLGSTTRDWLDEFLTDLERTDIKHVVAITVNRKRARKQPKG